MFLSEFFLLFFFLFGGGGGGEGGCHSNIEYTVSDFMQAHITTRSLGQSVTMQKTLLLSILHNKYLCMKCRKSNSALYGILFVMIPYDLIELQNCRYAAIRSPLELVSRSANVSPYNMSTSNNAENFFYYLNKTMGCCVRKIANLIPFSLIYYLSQ